MSLSLVPCMPTHKHHLLYMYMHSVSHMKPHTQRSTRHRLLAHSTLTSVLPLPADTRPHLGYCAGTPCSVSRNKRTQPRSMTLTQEHPCPRPPQAQLQATALPRRCGAPERQYGIPHLTRSATAAAVLPQGTTGEVIRADDTATNSSTMQLERPHTMIAAVCQQCPVCWR
jgi:hypothetical protein